MNICGECRGLVGSQIENLQEDREAFLGVIGETQAQLDEVRVVLERIRIGISQDCEPSWIAKQIDELFERVATKAEA